MRRRARNFGGGCARYKPGRRIRTSQATTANRHSVPGGSPGRPMRVLSNVDVHRLLDMAACIDAVEAAFAARARGKPATSTVAALELDGGVLHAKLGRLDARRRYAIAKIN